MNKLALVGATVAVLVFAAVAMAASPAPSAVPYASPAASPMASAIPSSTPASGTTSGSRSTTSVQKKLTSWTASINPVDIQGTASLTRNADGTGTLVLQLTGMVNQTNWTVDVEPGAIQHPNSANTIAFKQGEDVQKVAPDKIQVGLTKTEMQDFQHALSANPAGVTIFVSDGHRLSAATLTGTQQ
jgi:hypothetical protein